MARQQKAKIVVRWETLQQLAKSGSAMAQLENKLADAYKAKVKHMKLLARMVGEKNNREAVSQYELWSKACTDIDKLSGELRELAVKEAAKFVEK